MDIISMCPFSVTSMWSKKTSKKYLEFRVFLFILNIKYQNVFRLNCGTQNCMPHIFLYGFYYIAMTPEYPKLLIWKNDQKNNNRKLFKIYLNTRILDGVLDTFFILVIFNLLLKKLIKKIIQRLQFMMAKWLCNFSDTEIWKVFRAITELIYEWVEPKLPDKLLWYYFAIKPYIEDDIERHRKYVEWKKKWWIESWKVRKQKATIKVRKQNRSNWTEWTEWTEWTTDNDNDIYTNNIDIVNNIKEEEKEKLRKEFPNKKFRSRD